MPAPPTSPTFSLLTEPWIPVRTLDNTPLQFVGLIQLFQQVRHFKCIDDPSPLVTIALYRFCLALLHRALQGPKNAEQVARWYLEGWNTEEQQNITDYLQKYSEQFDLFDKQHPFWQVSDLTLELDGGKYESHWTRLSTEHGSANTAALFNLVKRPGGVRNDAISAAEAARRLIEHQNFALGGLIQRLTGSTIAAPMATFALTLPMGQNLHETFCLNLLPYSYDPEKDRAVWEKEPFYIDNPEHASCQTDSLREIHASKNKDAPRPLLEGPVEGFTWLSRAVRLYPEQDEQGALQVRSIGFAAGQLFTNTLDSVTGSGKTFDPMVTVVPNSSSTAKKPKPPLAQKLRLERLFWRDAESLFQSNTEGNQTPRNLQHARHVLELAEESERFDYASPVIPLMIFGQISDQAKALAYRQEQYTLPHAFVENPERFVDHIKEALEDAEKTGEKLRNAIYSLVKKALSSGNEEPSKATIKSVVKQIPSEASYWSQLEPAFRNYLRELDGDPEDLTNTDKIDNAKRALANWQRHIIRAAEDAWKLAVKSMGTAPNVWKAESLSYGIIAKHLSTLRKGLNNDVDTNDTNT